MKLAWKVSRMDDKLKELMDRQNRDKDVKKQHQSRKRRYEYWSSDNETMIISCSNGPSQEKSEANGSSSKRTAKGFVRYVILCKAC